MSEGSLALLVDDHDGNRMTMAALIEELGYRVVEATSLQEARAWIESRSFELCVLDLHLGDGLGSELIPTLRAQPSPPTIAILSGSDPGGTDADLVLEKGIHPTAILERLGAIMKRESNGIE